jgi:putative ABC transport system ATP-binding protein
VTAVVAEGLRRVYRTAAEEVIALDAVSLELRRGEIVALVGPSGSGKSTLIELLIGWDRPDAGTVRRDAAVTDDWTGMAVVPQSLGLLEELTISENIHLPVTLGAVAALDVDDLVRRLRLVPTLDLPPSAVSLGEQQRAAVARAMVVGPEVLVADEPTSHQDEANAFEIIALMREAARSSAVLVATHDRRVLELVDVVVELRDGRVV